MAKFFLQVLLAVVFYLLVTPIAIMLRLFNFDLLETNIDIQAYSYWRGHR